MEASNSAYRNWRKCKRKDEFDYSDEAFQADYIEHEYDSKANLLQYLSEPPLNQWLLDFEASDNEEVFEYLSVGCGCCCSDVGVVRSLLNFYSPSFMNITLVDKVKWDRERFFDDIYNLVNASFQEHTISVENFIMKGKCAPESHDLICCLFSAAQYFSPRTWRGLQQSLKVDGLILVVDNLRTQLRENLELFGFRGCIYEKILVYCFIRDDNTSGSQFSQWEVAEWFNGQHELCDEFDYSWIQEDYENGYDDGNEYYDVENEDYDDGNEDYDDGNEDYDDRNEYYDDGNEYYDDMMNVYCRKNVKSNKHKNQDDNGRNENDDKMPISNKEVYLKHSKQNGDARQKEDHTSKSTAGIREVRSTVCDTKFPSCAKNQNISPRNKFITTETTSCKSMKCLTSVTSSKLEVQRERELLKQIHNSYVNKASQYSTTTKPKHQTQTIIKVPKEMPHRTSQQMKQDEHDTRAGRQVPRYDIPVIEDENTCFLKNEETCTWKTRMARFLLCCYYSQ